MNRAEIEDELKAAIARRVEYMERLRLGGIAVLPDTVEGLRKKLRATNDLIHDLDNQLGNPL